MKLLVAVVLLFAVSASRAATDWSKVKPIADFYPHLAHRFKAMPSSLGNRIVGGVEVSPHSLPFQVALLIAMPDGTAFCGGSLLSSDWVLTAAHCAEPGSSFEVVLGAHNVREEEASQIRLISTQKIIHPQWNQQLLQNDIALIKLPQSVALNQNIQTIRLPSKSQLNMQFVNENTVASGWGKPSDAATGISPVLRRVESPVIPKLNCNIRYLGVIQDSHICTSGSGGKSTCSGDSGGPLTINETDGAVTQIGVVSFGIAFGCEIGWPPVFARVTSYAEWISGETGIPLRA